MTPSLDQKVVARKAKAKKCTAENVGDIQAKVERQHRLVTFLSVISPARSNPQKYTKMCVVNPHSFAGMVIIMWSQIVKLSSSL